MKESYIKLPNITTSKLQDVVDYLDENNIEYIEEYKRDEEIKRLKEEYVILQNASDEVEEEKDKEIERLNSIIKEVREYIKNNDTTFKVNEVVNAFGIPSIEFTIEPWKKDVLEILDKENNNEQ